MGAFIFILLFVSLGWAGMAITLLAWLIIALILVLDVSVVELFQLGTSAGGPHPGWRPGLDG